MVGDIAPVVKAGIGPGAQDAGNAFVAATRSAGCPQQVVIDMESSMLKYIFECPFDYHVLGRGGAAGAVIKYLGNGVVINERLQLFPQYFFYLIGSNEVRIKTGCLDLFELPAFMHNAPVGFGGATVGN